MPRFCTSFFVREKSWLPLFFSFSTSAAMCSERYSTAPPPIVPQMRPPRPTSILAPAPRGVAPEEATTVTSTRSSPAESRSAIVLNIALIYYLPSFPLAAPAAAPPNMPAKCRSKSLSASAQSSRRKPS